MCGIAGQLFLDGQPSVDPAFIRRMTDAIAHRGPDGEGLHVCGPVGLGHRRLSIIDLNTGAQPMCNEDGSVWVVFNGEIYNYLELRTELVARGHTFKSTTDTEVIVHLYEELGEQCVSRLRGMFAFAVWDQRRSRLFLARDRVGIKPLYYTTVGNEFLFASEIKALLVHPGMSVKFTPQGLDRFLTYYYLPGRDTLFEGIHKLEPGHCLSVAGGRLEIRQYWDLSFDARPSRRSFEEAVEALQAELRDSVGSHLMSDVPVGVLLSGGVDSTGVLRYAAEQSGRALHSFTVGFDGQEFADERPYARLAAKQYGTQHHELTITSQDFADFLPRYVRHMEEPVCEPPAVALYHVARLARDCAVKVLLSGEGGDEAFAGYNKYAYLLALESLKKAFGPAKGLLRRGLEWSAHLGSRSLPQYSDMVAPDLAQYYFSCTSSPRTPFNRAKARLYGRALAAAVDRRESDRPTRELFQKLAGQPMLNQMLAVDSKTWLPDDLLVKADKMTMAASVELRVPLLDHRVLEFAASLPPRFKVHGWPPKRILRAALKDSVPPEILSRKKIGFPVPYDRWMRSQLRDFVNDTLLSRGSALAAYFEADAIAALVNGHQQGEGGAQEVFSLMTLELLHREFVSGRSQPLNWSTSVPVPTHPQESRMDVNPKGATDRPRMLVTIASHGTKNAALLQRVIDQYHAMDLDIDVVVLSNIPRDLGPRVRVVVGLPSPDPWSLPFAHKAVFAENVENYDLFAYTEDDIGVSEHNVRSFMRATTQLEADEIAGFLRYEVDASGVWSLPDVHSGYRWIPTSARKRGACTIAEFSNEHAAFYLLTRDQLRAMVKRDGFVRAPYTGRYDLPCTAATDPYTAYGFRKVICISELDNFLVHHMSNRYSGQMGISLACLRRMVGALKEIADGALAPTTLFDAETRWPDGQWAKNYYERPSDDLLAMIPLGAESVLSIGCGYGATELILQARGIEVAAMPIDSVIGACVRGTGIEVVDGSFDECVARLRGRRFDCVVVSDLLHLLAEPEMTLRQCARLVGENGSLVVAGPNFDSLKVWAKRALNRGRYRSLGNYHEGGIHVVGPVDLRSFLAPEGLQVTAVDWRPDLRLSRSKTLAGRWSARSWALQACR